jgi:tetratricopeptide (TPR) repeat protein
MVQFLLAVGIAAGLAALMVPFPSTAGAAPKAVRERPLIVKAQGDYTGDLAFQFQKLIIAERREVAVLVEQEIWRLWFIGSTDAETARLAEASMVMRQGGLGEAIVLLGNLTSEFPNFAEARNQLAFARFLLGDLQGSLDDIAKVLVLEPRHFGALAGRARIEATMGKLDEAQRTMGQVGVIHPWMARLSPIRPNPPPPPPPEVRDL